MRDALFWIWLSLRVTPGSATFPSIIKAFSDIYDVYTADREALTDALPKNCRDLEALSDKSIEDAKRVLTYCNRAGIVPIAYDDARFPASLRKIKAPPVMLYCRGQIPAWNEKLCVSIVGTRKMNRYGMQMTFEVARDLAIAGVIVISGMARGIDAVANAAAINGGGQTVAVLGSGLDIIYPPEHEKLAAFITRHGCLVSEFPPGTRPTGSNFPIRNRIISGMATAVAVMQGELESGSLITARHATQQEKTLFALPGPVNDPLSGAPCLLLREGAHTLTCADDILTYYAEEYYGKINIQRLLTTAPVLCEKVLTDFRIRIPGCDISPSSGSDRSLKTVAPLEKEKEVSHAVSVPPREAAPEKPDRSPEPACDKRLTGLPQEAVDLYARLPEGKEIPADELAEDGMSVSKVMAVATLLEIRGLVRMQPGGRLLRC